MRDEVGDKKIDIPQMGIDIEQKYQNIVNKCLMEPEKIIRHITELHELEYEKVACKNTGYKAIRDEMIKEIRISSNLSLREIGSFFEISESAVSKILGKSL